MLRTLKFTGNESDYHFISDLHYGHNRDFIYGKRNFTSVTEHDNHIVYSWNAQCGNHSTVFHLGDFIFNDGDGKRFYELLRKLKFKELHLLTGNHTSGQRQAYIDLMKQYFPDSVDEYNHLNYEVYPMRLDLDNTGRIVYFWPEYLEVHINSTMLVLSHYPIVSHNKLGKGSIHLCGHSHGRCELTNVDHGSGMRLDVGVESFGRPISLKEVRHHLKDRTLDSRDHHGEDTT